MKTVLVAGSAVVDMVFEVPAFPDRAEKYRASAARITGGGCAGNAAVAIARLGGHARILARSADDFVGAMTRGGLEEAGVDTSLWQIGKGGQSAYSSILVDPAGERQIVAFRGSGLPERPEGDFGTPDAVLADTRWPEAGEIVLAHAARLGVPGVLDGEAPVTEPLLRAASHVAFSAQGLRELTGQGDLSAGLRDVATRTGAWLCVTDGAAGILALKEGEETRTPAFPITPVDTLGAGDVWHGAFTLALAEGQTETQATRFAAAAAALKCMAPGGRDGCPDRAATLDFIKRTVTT